LVIHPGTKLDAAHATAATTHTAAAVRSCVDENFSSFRHFWFFESWGYIFNGCIQVAKPHAKALQHYHFLALIVYRFQRMVFVCYLLKFFMVKMIRKK
jgi:hypothetical protein